MTIAGIVLIVVGAIFMFRGGFSFGSQREVLRIGDLEVSAEERRQAPDWLGGVAILGGILLIGAGVQGRRSA
jgi:drug/metabolite transporter (DMT)-like permease